MRRRPTQWFSVSTTRGRSWYHDLSRAMSAARWIGRETGEHVEVSSEATGHIWNVAPVALPIPAAAR